MDSLLQFGLLKNAFSSGDGGHEYVIAFVATFLAPFVAQLMRTRNIIRIAEEFVNRILYKKDCVTRIVSYSVSMTPYGPRPCADYHNLTVQKAILAYVNSGEYQKSQRVSMRDGMLMLIDANESRDDCDETDARQGDCDKSRIVVKPLYSQWVTVSRAMDHEIQMRRNHSITEVGEGHGSIGEEELELRAYSTGDPELVINNFVDEAYQYYKRDLKRRFLSDRRYFLACGREEKSIVFKKYTLSSDRTFDTVYHPEMPRVRKIVDDFVNKTGKYAMPGFPYKLGVLLHGPPGTGKTTFIKAIANHTDRHIVNVSLNKIKTNGEFEDIMYNEKYKINEGDDNSFVTIPNNKTIFILEDVDAASKVVADRNPHAANKPAANANQVVRDANATAGATAVAAAEENPDRLTLAGILNVLDGVLESPGRIVVMTTNHEEKLDPALTRPGRVNLWIKMDHIRLEEAMKMLRSFFRDEEVEATKAEFAEGFRKVRGGMSPAHLEMLCGGYDNVSDLVRGMVSEGRRA